MSEETGYRNAIPRDDEAVLVAMVVVGGPLLGLAFALGVMLA